MCLLFVGHSVHKSRRNIFRTVKPLWYRYITIPMATVPGGWTGAVLLVGSDAGNRWAEPGVNTNTRIRKPTAFLGNHSTPLSGLVSITALHGMMRTSRVVKVFSKIERDKIIVGRERERERQTEREMDNYGVKRKLQFSLRYLVLALYSPRRNLVMYQKWGFDPNYLKQYVCLMTLCLNIK
jgi:hypothetical protein